MPQFEEHPSKVSAWRDGRFVVLPDAEDADCTIWFAVGSGADNDVQWEGLLGRHLDDDRARVCAVPFWVYNLNLGDEVHTVRSLEEALVAVEPILDSGNYTYRVFFTSEEDDDLSWRELQRDLEQFDCWFDVRTPRFTAISCSPTYAQAVADYLMSRERDGDLHYETGRAAAPDD